MRTVPVRPRPRRPIACSRWWSSRAMPRWCAPTNGSTTSPRASCPSATASTRRTSARWSRRRARPEPARPGPHRAAAAMLAALCRMGETGRFPPLVPRMNLLSSVEHETGPDPRYSVIWLHGLGADGNDFAPIVPELVDAAWPALRFVFPHAPVQPVSINGGVPMRAWYDIYGFDARAAQDEAGIRRAIDAVEALTAREHARGVPSERIVLAGFSQGGAIALAAGLRDR